MVLEDIKIGEVYEVDLEPMVYAGLITVGKGKAHCFLGEYGTLFLNTASLKNKLETGDCKKINKSLYK